MANYQDKAWNRRRYDSYRPATKSEVVSGLHSPSNHTGSEVVQHYSNKSWHRAKYSSNATTQTDASSTLRTSRDQSEDHSPPAAPLSNRNSTSTGHDSEQLNQKLTNERKDTSMPKTTPSRNSSRTVDQDKHESEAQSRGFYGSSRSPTSDVFNLGRYQLKRPREDGGTDRSIKRRRAAEEEKDDDADEPASALDNHRPPPVIYQCKNYMCMENHAYQECDKPKVCWGCRSTNHYWTHCPETCTSCGAARHTAKHCEDFEPTQGGKGSMPRACRPHPPTEPDSDRERTGSLEHEHGGSPLPKKPVRVVFPGRDRSQRRHASHTISNSSPPSRQATESQRSAPTEENMSETVKDPRLRRGSASTPRASPLASSLQTPLEPGSLPSIEPQLLGSPPPKHPQHRPLTVLTTPPHGPIPQETHQSQSPSRTEDHLMPDASATSAEDSLLDARTKAFEAGQRLKRREHVEEMARRRRELGREFEREMEDVFGQKDHDADMVRRAEVQSLEEEHEARLAALRRL